ncbi:MAG: class I SAM-dependent methyltransferase, partial [Myxococcales bacterium]|nr:class I SAM-dependent methyltransferase [Myxococcales bacterium]
MRLAEWHALLAAAGLALRPEEPVRARIEAFLEARAHWSRTHNLSGPRALDDPWATDVLDGMAVADCAASGLALIDVGAGSGVPGLLVACA